MEISLLFFDTLSPLKMLKKDSKTPQKNQKSLQSVIFQLHDNSSLPRYHSLSFSLFLILLLTKKAVNTGKHLD